MPAAGKETPAHLEQRPSKSSEQALRAASSSLDGNFCTMNSLFYCAFGGLRVRGYSPVALRFLCFLPELTFRKKFVGDTSKDGMGLSCLLLREAVAV